jgi:hypothetical protein
LKKARQTIAKHQRNLKAKEDKSIKRNNQACMTAEEKAADKICRAQNKMQRVALKEAKDTQFQLDLDAAKTYIDLIDANIVPYAV